MDTYLLCMRNEYWKIEINMNYDILTYFLQATTTENKKFKYELIGRKNATYPRMTQESVIKKRGASSVKIKCFRKGVMPMTKASICKIKN